MVIQKNLNFVSNTTIPVLSKTFINASGDVLSLEIKGNGVIYIDGRLQDDSDWFSIAGINLSDFSVSKDGFTKPGLYEIGVIGIRQLRARVEAVQDNVSVYGQIISSEET